VVQESKPRKTVLKYGSAKLVFVKTWVFVGCHSEQPNSYQTSFK